MTTEASATSSSEVTAEEYLHRVRTALKTDAPTTGSGKYAVLSGSVVGGELSADDKVVHLSAFPNDDRGNGELVGRQLLGESPLARPSIRKWT